METEDEHNVSSESEDEAEPFVEEREDALKDALNEPLESESPWGFVVTSFIEEHNLALATGASRMFLRCKRKLSSTHEDIIMHYGKVKLGATIAHNLAKEMYGAYDNVDKKRNVKQQLTGLFWVDAIGKRNYDVFGEIVSFDPTFRTNKYNMVFVPFTGVDNHWKNVTFVAALIEKEDYDKFKWLLLAFEKSKVGPTLSCNKKFMEKLKSIVYADHLIPQEFEDGW
ncbi:hypothetical protein POM88_039055 [Heracleum sosnowskyi]|uniref:MULE transposase domain-containing protein n=1 Tax=Heracleum sosnowskyi TaxID=360622 RepID=A0AAD8HBV7_9APIA|nr:hypothetical protein POM88_039055 [Heracleum sosnowskyi]